VRECQASQRNESPLADVATYPILFAQIAIPNTSEPPGEIEIEMKKQS
jgi:hypothetical protein